jgi:carbohydrate kinase (thermoresistant glucokinase family)
MTGEGHFAAPGTGEQHVPHSIVVMGVSSAGKSTVGEALAARMGMRFVDADALHPPRNIAKMSAGIPLTDADRAPWLELVGRELAGAPIVVACSALKRVYRDRLRRVAPTVRFVHLHGERHQLMERAARRTDHFMPPSLLDSQLTTLERPQPDEQVWEFSIMLSVAEIVEAVARKLASPAQLAGSGPAVTR